MNYGPETFPTRMPDDGMAPELPRGRWAFVDPDEPMAPGRLVGVDDPETGVATVRRLVVAAGAGSCARPIGPGRTSWWRPTTRR